MGKRLTKIYTRTGDDGSTGLGNGERVAKDHARVEAYGTVDELNSAIGVVIAADTLPEPVATLLERIQHELFDLGGELCIPGHVIMTAEMVAGLESALDELNANLPALREFILPGGTRASAACHLARAVCRRAERRAFSLASEADLNPHALTYLNRLSDLLFVVARELNRAAGHPETLWRHERGSRED